MPAPDSSDGERKQGGERATGSAAAPVEAVGEALRAAVERTLAATAGSAGETRGRAQALLDDVVRRGEQAREEVSRRGNAARRRVTRRGEEATARLADALAELRSADAEGMDRLSERVAAVEERLQALEQRAAGSAGAGEAGVRRTEPQTAQSNPQAEGERKSQKGLD